MCSRQGGLGRNLLLHAHALKHAVAAEAAHHKRATVWHHLNHLSSDWPAIRQVPARRRRDRLGRFAVNAPLPTAAGFLGLRQHRRPPLFLLHFLLATFDFGPFLVGAMRLVIRQLHRTKRMLLAFSPR